MDKRGLLGYAQLAGIVMLLVVAGIMLVVGGRVQSDLVDGVSSDTTLLKNATTTTINDASNTTDLRGRVKGVTECHNATGASGIVETIPSTNWSWSATNPSRIYIHKGVQGGFPWDGAKWNCTYTVLTDTTEYNASSPVLEGVSSVAEQQGLLGLVIIFGIIIGVVVIAFMTRGIL